MKQEIAQINHQDIPALVEMINLSYRNDIAGAWTTEAHLFDEGGLRIDESEIKEIIAAPNSHIFKYERDGILLGTVTLKENTDSIYLGTLAVSPQSQGLGIGKKFLNFAKDFAIEKKKSSIILSAISVRTELIAWYERFGFQKTGKLIPFPVEHTLSNPVDNLFFEEMVFHI